MFLFNHRCFSYSVLALINKLKEIKMHYAVELKTIEEAKLLLSTGLIVHAEELRAMEREFDFSIADLRVADGSASVVAEALNLLLEGGAQVKSWFNSKARENPYNFVASKGDIIVGVQSESFAEAVRIALDNFGKAAKAKAEVV
jgi:hypothetical protein